MCCLFGLMNFGETISRKKKEKYIKVLSRAAEARGTDATGIAFVGLDGNIVIDKAALPASKMRFKLKGNPSIVMGHTRMTTQGTERDNFNNHPFNGKAKGQFAFAHNGVLHNDTTIRSQYKLPQTKIKTDSYIGVQLIEQKGELNFESMKYVGETVSGSFCFTALSQNNELYILKGSNPMCIYDFGDFMLYASTKVILDNAVKELGLTPNQKIDIESGDILKFSKLGIETSSFDYEDYYGYNYSYKANSWSNKSSKQTSSVNNSCYSGYKWYDDYDTSYDNYYGYGNYGSYSSVYDNTNYNSSYSATSNNSSYSATSNNSSYSATSSNSDDETYRVQLRALMETHSFTYKEIDWMFDNLTNYEIEDILNSNSMSRQTYNWYRNTYKNNVNDAKFITEF